MSNSLRREVLQSFKKLHRTRQKIFEGDNFVLDAARKEINKEFRTKKNMTDQSAIEEAVKFANAVEHELRTTVIQGVKTDNGKYTLKITPDTVKLDNMPFKDCGSA